MRHATVVVVLLVGLVGAAMGGCADCERYIEQVKGISKAELERLGGALEASGDLLLSVSSGCDRVSPDFTAVCRVHEATYGWAGIDELVSGDGEDAAPNVGALCADLESCVETMLGESDGVELRRNGRREKRSRRAKAYGGASEDGSGDEVISAQGGSYDVMPENLSGEDKRALDQVMLALNKGWFRGNHRANQAAAAAAAARAAEAQAKARADAAEREAAALRARLAAEAANRQAAGALRNAEAERQAMRARERAFQARDARGGQQQARRADNRARTAKEQIRAINKENRERDRLTRQMQALPKGITNQMAAGALSPDRAVEAARRAAAMKANEPCSSKKVCQADKDIAVGDKKAKKAGKSADKAKKDTMSSMSEMGNLMNAMSAMNSPLLTVGSNDDFNNLMDQYDDKPVVDNKDGATPGCCAKGGVPSEGAIEELGNNNAQSIAMMPMLFTGKPNPMQLTMAISGM